MFGCDLPAFSHWGGWLVAVLFFGAGALLTYALSGKQKRVNRNADSMDSMEILRARLARGDITVEEYTALKAALFQ